ncbi:hypothetical protein EV356DRAFT_574825 [Viridothelium virens]|uniref:Uncharacterized protein n=1 Tax=Viridothelium virens TaxID=1048519 RepID=A0A6A6HET4_VIRVR|nr:hypothetical protein EV356DRAFT_574825 [Viridothelium virens]
MLPAVPSKVLDQNPRFQVLYENLATSKLNPNGSSRVSTSNEGTEKELNNIRIELSKRQLVIDGLQRVAQNAAYLPIELLQVIELVAAHSDGQLPDVDIELLEVDFEYLKDNADDVASAISKDLSKTLKQMLCIINMTGPWKINQSDGTSDSLLGGQRNLSIAKAIVQRRVAIKNDRQDLLKSRERIASLACEVLNAHTACLDIGIRTLEQTIHGSVARGTRAQTEHLSTVAEGICGKSVIAAYQAQSSLYTPELISALQNYTSHLESTTARLKRREGTAEDELEAYEEAGDGMRDIARRFAEVKAEIEKVQGEMRRLDSR